MKNKKGQIAIEYIIFISVLLLFFQAIVYPNINFSENVITDIYNATQTKQSIEKLAEGISSFSSSSGYGTRSVYFYLPNNGEFKGCVQGGGVTNLSYSVQLSQQNPKPSYISSCDVNALCNFKRKIYIGKANITCTAVGPGFNGYLKITKEEDGDIIVEP